MHRPITSSDTYLAPEVVGLGNAATLTLGQMNLTYLDGCNCSKACQDDGDLLGC
jgi:hypothetical protein